MTLTVGKLNNDLLKKRNKMLYVTMLVMLWYEKLLYPLGIFRTENRVVTIMFCLNDNLFKSVK